MHPPFFIRPMQKEDFVAADGLRQQAGWNQTLRDWSNIYSLNPELCFVADSPQGIVGTVTGIIHDPTLAWIGMVLVNENCRGAGVGRQLMEKVIQHIRAQNIPKIGLDATPAGRFLYQKLGFTDALSLERWSGLASAPVRQPTSSIRPIHESDWPGILKFDLEATGFDRNRVLRRLCADGNHAQSAILMDRDRGQILAYGFSRAGARAGYLGPIVATQPETGADILQYLLEKFPAQHPVFWDLFPEQQEILEIAKTMEFTFQRPLTRMFSGPPVSLASPSYHWAIADPAAG